jgi:protein tyrosine phosphatase (PTP) superfamily phosphohydrolase (DUF442 family)
VFLIPLLAVGCFRTPPPSGPTPVPCAVLHNVYRLTDRVLSGSGPEGEAGFAALHDLGVRTIISVDGATPNVAAAKKYGMRYVHIPIGYDGIPEDTAWRLTRAATELPGPVYVHCHHGIHRGPTAAAAVLMCSREWDGDKASAWLKTAGTDPRYQGLVSIPRTLRLPPPGEIAKVPAEYPEVATVPDLTRAMVAIDQRWDRLKAAKAAGWKTTPGHPDIDPSNEAVQLAEQFRELIRGSDPREHVTGFQKMLSEQDVKASELDRILRAKPLDRVAADRAFAACAETCVKCHTGRRD